MRIEYSYPTKGAHDVQRYISVPKRPNEVEAVELFSQLVHIPGLKFKYESDIQDG